MKIINKPAGFVNIRTRSEKYRALSQNNTIMLEFCHMNGYN